jgi:hypothetical protein
VPGLSVLVALSARIRSGLSFSNRGYSPIPGSSARAALPIDGVAGFASGGLLDELENLLESLDLAPSLALVFLERGLQIFRLRSFRHLRKSCEDLLFGVIDVFQSLVKQIFKQLLFFGHKVAPASVAVQRSNAAPCREVPILLGLAKPRGVAPLHFDVWFAEHNLAGDVTSLC